MYINLKKLQGHVYIKSVIFNPLILPFFCYVQTKEITNRASSSKFLMTSTFSKECSSDEEEQYSLG